MDITCPKCKGVPEHPEIEGCQGCMACDFTGTLEAFQRMEELDRHAMAALPRGRRDDFDDSHLT